MMASDMSFCHSSQTMFLSILPRRDSVSERILYLAHAFFLPTSDSRRSLNPIWVWLQPGDLAGAAMCFVGKVTAYDWIELGDHC